MTPDELDKIQRDAFAAGFIHGSGYGYLGGALADLVTEFEEWKALAKTEVVEATKYFPRYEIPGYHTK